MWQKTKRAPPLEDAVAAPPITKAPNISAVSSSGSCALVALQDDHDDAPAVREEDVAGGGAVLYFFGAKAM